MTNISVGNVVGDVLVGDFDRQGNGNIIVETYSDLNLYNSSGNKILKFADLTVPHHAVLRMPSPAAGNIADDSKLEIMFGDKESRRFYAWKIDGSSLTGFPKTLSGSIYSTAALADIDNDGYDEIAIGCDVPAKIYLIDNNGSYFTGWPKDVGGNIRSKPAFGDIDGDGELEIVVTTSTDDGYTISFSTLYAFNLDGSTVPGWPIDILDLYGEGTYFMSPALGDINNDGIAEIIISTEKANLDTGSSLIVFDGNGFELWKKPINVDRFSSPVIGNIDPDSEKEIVVGANYYVYAFENDGTLKWRNNLPSGDEVGSTPLLFDITGDGIKEVFVTTIWDGGDVLGWYGSGDNIPFMNELPVSDHYIFGTPAIFDFDNDGILELTVGTGEKWQGPAGYLYAWNLEYTGDGSNGDSPGGGGGGGGSSGEDHNNIKAYEYVSQFVFAGNRIIYNFTLVDPIINVEFTALQSADRVTSLVEVLYNTSSLVNKPAPYNVYRNVNIYIGFAGYANEQNIKDAIVTFRVGKDWVGSSGIDRNSITLYKYTNGSWIVQPTGLRSEDDTHVYYQSDVTGFSQFAICGLTMNEQIPATPTGTADSVEIDNSEKAVQTDNKNLEFEKSNKLSLFIGLLFVIIVLFLLVWYKKINRD